MRWERKGKKKKKKHNTRRDSNPWPLEFLLPRHRCPNHELLKQWLLCQTGAWRTSKSVCYWTATGSLAKQPRAFEVLTAVPYLAVPSKALTTGDPESPLHALSRGRNWAKKGSIDYHLLSIVSLEPSKSPKQDPKLGLQVDHNVKVQMLFGHKTFSVGKL